MKFIRRFLKSLFTSYKTIESIEATSTSTATVLQFNYDTYDFLSNKSGLSKDTIQFIFQAYEKSIKITGKIRGELLTIDEFSHGFYDYSNILKHEVTFP